MGKNIYNFCLFAAAFQCVQAFAADAGHRPPGKLKITYFSHSTLKDGTICEGSFKDKTLSGGKQFDDLAVKSGQPPKTVALQGKHKANGCTLTFTDGPYAGKSVPVGDTNGNDTIDIAIDTRESKNKAACQAVLNGTPGSSQMVGYQLTGCPGAAGGRGPSARATGATTRLPKP